MELSQFTDYSLRVLIFAGLSDRLVSVPEIAETYQISQHHLVKVVHHLSKHGFLDTFRGRGGGFRLAKGPSASLPAAASVASPVVAHSRRPWSKHVRLSWKCSMDTPSLICSCLEVPFGKPFH